MGHCARTRTCLHRILRPDFGHLDRHLDERVFQIFSNEINPAAFFTSRNVKGFRQAGVVTADLVMAEQVMAAAGSEENLLESAVREHAQLVYRIAYSVLRNSSEAEDAVQDTFLRVLRYGNKAARVQDQKAWLARIAWRVAVERRSKLVHSSARDEAATADLASTTDSPDRVLMDKERRETLDRFIAALPEQLRDPLILATIEELSPREVGSVIGISEAAVRSRAFRARQILRERMATWMGERQ